MNWVAELRLASRSDSARAARLRVREALGEVEPDVRRDAELVASELIANAVRHAGSGRVSLRVWLQPGRCVRIEVADGSSDLPQRCDDLEPTDEQGRGLHLVETLGAASGAFRKQGAGKIVWCEMTLDELESPA